MSRRSNTGQRRDEIVRALQAVMAEHGYEKATIQLIARQAGLTPGLLHYHFQTKADILVELVKVLANQAHARYLALAESAVTAQERLRAYLDARLALGPGADAHAVAAWVVIGAEAVRQPEVRSVYRHAVRSEMELVTELMAACLAERQKPTAGARALAAAVLALVEGAYQLASAAPDIAPPGYAAPTALCLVERFIAGA
jgi:TetR/AcrR family transcriptional repressor of bet genes